MQLYPSPAPPPVRLDEQLQGALKIKRCLIG
ncbi:hypothetical protein ACVWZ4_004997 [Bradyrhizobium sp. USDA 4472]